MTKPLADQFGPDTTRKLEHAAPKRLSEARELFERGCNLAAIYLCGYAVEMVIKAAFFKMLRYTPTAEIDRDARNRVIARARQAGLMSSEPHDIAGWARSFVNEKETLHPSRHNKEMELREQIIAKAAIIYTMWRPEMRYRTTDAKDTLVKTAIEIADWFIANHPKF